MLRLLCVVVCVAVCSAERIKGTFQSVDFEGFKSEYNKVYTSSEEQQRYEAYVETVDFINQHNAEYDQGLHSYWCGVNEYSDLTSEEWKMLRGYIEDPREQTLPERIPEDYDERAHKSVDWRTKGAVGPVLNQGMCGSCWAFGSSEALDGQFFQHKGKLSASSQQQLVSCDKTSHGCGGGNPFTAYTYIQTNRGISTLHLPVHRKE